MTYHLEHQQEQPMLNKKDLTIEQVKDLVVFLVGNKVQKFKGMGLELDLIPGEIDPILKMMGQEQQEVQMTDTELQNHYNSRRI